MNNTNANSSTASKEVKMGFKVSGGFFAENRGKLEIRETETINQSIPMFEVVEKSFGKYKRGKNSKGEDVIVTGMTKFVKGNDGKFVATPRTKVAER